MNTPQELQNLQNFLPYYEDYDKNILKPTKKEIEDLFILWEKREFWGENRLGRFPTPSPINECKVRIKRPERLVDKITRQPATFPDGLAPGSLRILNDAVAGRIVVYFLSNLPLINEAILNEESLEISDRNKPVAYFAEWQKETTKKLNLRNVRSVSKPSGYTSIHYIVRFKKSIVPINDRPWFEIQVRTLTQHVWSEIEELLGYKPDDKKQPSYFLRKQFHIICSHLTTIDEHFDLLLDEVNRQQSEITFNDDSSLSVENLPSVLNSNSIGCAQKEILIFLNLLNDRGIKTVGSLRKTISSVSIDLIRDIFRNYRSREPENAEIVASIAAARGLDSRDEIIKAIEIQINFLELWQKLKA